ncbi:MAG: metallophosphoesterase family protein, partial [Chloroflexota bacterium]
MATQRFAVLSDIHGNLAALDAALADAKRHKPDRVIVTGDLVFNGPRPGETLDRLRALEGDGAIVVQGNTDIAVADQDYSAAFPWMEDVPAAQRAAAEWAHDQLSDGQLDYLRRLPAERRLWVDETLVLATHASPGSMTAGLSTDLDPTVTVERVTRTDARVICCGHTHVANVRELGRKLILNPGSCGYAFDGDASACWALLTLPDGEDAEPTAELFRPLYDAAAAAEEVAQRGLPG